MNIKEIASLCGVSVATVSRCINQPDKVAAPTREKIMRIIEKKDYVPNPSARSLSTGTTRTIGCVVPNLGNIYFTELVHGCQEILNKLGYHLLIYKTEGETDFWGKFNQRAVDGLIFSGIDIKEDIKSLTSTLTIPYVVIDHADALKKHPKISTVYIDDEAGVGMALEYLYLEGNRRFGILLGNDTDDTPLAARRFKVVENFFKAHPDASYISEHGNYVDLQVSKEACDILMAHPERPTAIFAFSDMIAAGALRSLYENRIKVPEEVEIIGFDDIPMCAFFTPALTTISAPNYDLGATAAQILIDKINGTEEVKHVLYPVEIMIRETTMNKVKPANE